MKENKIMKVLSTIGSSFLITSVVCYVIGLFIFSDVNCFNWPHEEKVVITVFGLLFFLSVCLWLDYVKKFD